MRRVREVAVSGLVWEKEPSEFVEINYYPHTIRSIFGIRTLHKHLLTTVGIETRTCQLAECLCKRFRSIFGIRTLHKHLLITAGIEMRRRQLAGCLCKRFRSIFGIRTMHKHLLSTRPCTTSECLL